MATPRIPETRSPTQQTTTTADVNRRIAIWLDLICEVAVQHGIIIPEPHGDARETTSATRSPSEHEEAQV